MQRVRAPADPLTSPSGSSRAAAVGSGKAKQTLRALPLLLAICLTLLAWSVWRSSSTSKPAQADLKAAAALSTPAYRMESHHEAAFAAQAPSPVVCLLGNAQTVALARKVSAYWPTYHAFWAVWGQAAVEVPAGQTPLSWGRVFGNHGTAQPATDVVFWPFSCPKGACPWKVGIEQALAQARASGVPCEYYFTADDDSDWYLSADPTAPGYNTDKAVQPVLVSESGEAVTVCTELTHLLRTWHPAVASFAWEYGEKSFGGAMEHTKAAGASAVSVLTSFDNGNALYHASVIDFIIPFGPNGEGGFVGNWTLPASWLNMLVPFAFQGQALRISSMFYTNNMNMNNGEATLGHKPKTVMENGNFVTEAARHPYEFPRRKPFEAYMSTGIVPQPGAVKSDINGVPSYRWGQHLFPADVDWVLSVGHPPFLAPAISAQLATRFDITHAAAAGPLRRWVTAQARGAALRVVQLTSNNDIETVASALADLFSPVREANGGLGTTGMLASTAMVTTTLSVLLPAPWSVPQQADWQRHTKSAVEGFAAVAILTAVPVVSAPVVAPEVAVEDDAKMGGANMGTLPGTLPSVTSVSSLLQLLETVWPTGSGAVGRVEHLVLLRAGRRGNRQAYHWANACAAEFARWPGVLGCAMEPLPIGSKRGQLPKGFQVRSAKPQLQVFAGGAAAPTAAQAADAMGAVSAASVTAPSSVFYAPCAGAAPLLPPDLLTGSGFLVTRAAWDNMVLRLREALPAAVAVAAAAGGGADGGTGQPEGLSKLTPACAQLLVAPSGESLVSFNHAPGSSDVEFVGPALWTLVQSCLPVPGACSALVFPQVLP